VSITGTPIAEAGKLLRTGAFFPEPFAVVFAALPAGFADAAPSIAAAEIPLASPPAEPLDADAMVLTSFFAAPVFLVRLFAAGFFAVVFLADAAFLVDAAFARPAPLAFAPDRFGFAADLPPATFVFFAPAAAFFDFAMLINPSVFRPL
jgi:hypothetical protein